MKHNIVGVDGCPSGWLTCSPGKETLQFEVFSAIRELATAFPKTTTFFIDMPIGLPDSRSKVRVCDKEARLLLGARRASVFSPPTRRALAATSYEDASRINYSQTGKKLSLQAFNIAAKIRELDSFLRRYPNYRTRFFETHPELVFLVLHGQPLEMNKRSMNGQKLRLQLITEALRKGLGTAATLPASIRGARQDDILDATALAVAASKWQRKPSSRKILGGDLDAARLPRRICFAET